MAIVRCVECGKEYSDTLEACPHCGFGMKNSQFNYASKQIEEKQNVDAMCLAGGVVSICSFFLDFFGLVAVTGIVLSVLGLERTKTTGANGKNWAIAGIIIGALEALYKVIQITTLL